MSQNLQPLSIEQLRPFPLDQALSNLPQKFREEFASSYELVKGYTRSLHSYQDLEEQARIAVKETIATINAISSLLEEYEENAVIIAQRAQKADTLYKEFLTLETLQYQLLSASYNQDFLKAKFTKLASDSDEKSDAIVGSYRKNGGDMMEFLTKFKNSRTAYHGRREKLNRWNEDRVGGFI